MAETIQTTQTLTTAVRQAEAVKHQASRSKLIANPKCWRCLEKDKRIKELESICDIHKGYRVYNLEAFKYMAGLEKKNSELKNKNTVFKRNIENAKRIWEEGNCDADCDKMYEALVGKKIEQVDWDKREKEKG